MSVYFFIDMVWVPGLTISLLRFSSDLFLFQSSVDVFLAPVCPVPTV